MRIKLITPLTLGHKTFPINLIQGPLAGISCAPFRKLVWQYSQPAFCNTEMISCINATESASLRPKTFYQ